MNKNNKDDFIELLKGLFMIGSWIIGLICSILVFIYRIQHPELTDTQLMLYSWHQYWWVVLLIIISTLIDKK